MENRTSADNPNGWSKYQMLVLAELQRHNDWLASLDGRIGKIREDIVALKVKAGMWGLAGATLPAIGVILFYLLKG